MKFAALPFCAIAFIGLSIAQVVLTHFHLIALGPIWLVLTSYSAVIAAAAWGDRHTKQQPLINYGGSAGRALAGFDGWAPDDKWDEYIRNDLLIFGETALRMTSSFNNKA